LKKRLVLILTALNILVQAQFVCASDFSAALGFELEGVWRSEADLLANPVSESDLLVTAKGGSYEGLLYGGLTLSQDFVKEGEFSGRWANRPYFPTISYAFSPMDWSSFTHLGLWVYSETVIEEEVFILLESENAQTNWRDFYIQSFTVDFCGWRYIEKPLAGFQTIGTPAGWSSVKQISFCTKLGGKSPNPFVPLYLDGLSPITQEGGILAGNAFNAEWSYNADWRNHHDIQPFDYVIMNHTFPEMATSPQPGIPFRQEPYFKDVRAVYGYFPRYNSAPVSIDRNGRAVLNHGYVLQVIGDDGLWDMVDLNPAIKNYMQNVLGRSSFKLRDNNAFNDAIIRFDSDNDAYATVTIDTVGRRYCLLLHSSDGMKNWRVYRLPYDIARFERPDGHNDIYSHPPVILNSPTSGGDVYLITPLKNNDGMLELSEPILLGTDAISIASQSGLSNFAVSKGDKLYFVYGVLGGSHNFLIPENHPANSMSFVSGGALKYCRDGVPAFIKTYDYATGEVSQPVFIGYGGINSADGHNWPSITMDSAGRLHVVINGHHDPFFYTVSQNPLDISSWGQPDLLDTAGAMASYASIATDTEDTMYIVYRDSSRGYHMDLSLLRKKNGESWEKKRLLEKEKPFYASLMNSLTYNPVSGKLFVAYTARSPIEGMFKDEYDAYIYRYLDLEIPMLTNSPPNQAQLPLGTAYTSPNMQYNFTSVAGERAVLISDDGGNSFHLAQTDDFVPLRKFCAYISVSFGIKNQDSVVVEAIVKRISKVMQGKSRQSLVIELYNEYNENIGMSYLQKEFLADEQTIKFSMRSVNGESISRVRAFMCETPFSEKTLLSNIAVSQSH